VALEESAARERWPDFACAPFARAPEVNRTLVDESSFRLAHSRLGRQMRRLSRLSAGMRTYSGENSEAIRRLYDCKRSHFAEDNLFLDQRRCDFLVALAALEGKNCELFTLETDTALVAGLLTFRDGGIRRFYTIYFDPEWARHSPGVALVYEVTARSLAEGLSCDYMTGEYPYKLRLANASRALYKIEMSAQELAKITAEKARSVA
jgi:CelD/BcsL family acetyltransferase involved in cellulose biosynthesis